MYQCCMSGEYYMYKFYEVNTGMHYLIGNNETISVDSDVLKTHFIEVDYEYGY